MAGSSSAKKSDGIESNSENAVLHGILTSNERVKRVSSTRILIRSTIHARPIGSPPTNLPDRSAHKRIRS